MIARALLFVAAIAVAASAHAQDWTCSYPGYGTDRLVIVRYLREGDFLVEERFRVRFRILEDTPEGVVAAWSYAARETDPNGPGIMGTIIAINKETGDFSTGHVRVPAERTDRTVSGRCIAD